MKIVTIIGARPQIIKASALSRAIKEHFTQSIKEIIVHTGQHYDENMSEVFFKELNIPSPNYNLGVKSASHGVQTAKMIVGIEEILLQEKPNAIVLYGDTNSTLAGAIAAAKIHVPIVHIEAGLRSFDKNMPEEINRIMCDNVSTLLFSPSLAGYNNLIREGFSQNISSQPDFNHPNIYHCGDIMLDNTLFFKQIAQQNESFQHKYGKDFILCTIHRNANTDNKNKLSSIFRSLLRINHKIILPLHPRTKKMMPIMLDKYLFSEVMQSENIEIIEPVSYLAMTYLENNCSLVITDSGGVQKEAYYMSKPCIILRPETEWVEIVQTGNAIIADTDEDKIVASANKFLNSKSLNPFIALFGNGRAAEFMCQTMLNCLG